MSSLEFFILRRAGGEPLSSFHFRTEARRILELSYGESITTFRVRCNIGDLESVAPHHGLSRPFSTPLGDVILSRGIDSVHPPRFSHQLFVARMPSYDLLFFTKSQARQYRKVLMGIFEPIELYTAQFDLCRLDALEELAEGVELSFQSSAIGQATVTVSREQSAPVRTKTAPYGSVCTVVQSQETP